MGFAVPGVFGVAFGLLLLALVGAGLWWSWRHPFVGFGVLVAGMAFHSFALMLLLRLDAPYVLVRLVQAWKELLLAQLLAIATGRLWRAHREHRLGALVATDWIAIALTAVGTIYFLIPSHLMHSDVNLAQRAVAFRLMLLIPVLYFLGRVVGARDDGERRAVVWLALGSAAVVTIFGVYELFFVPTQRWLDWGVNLYTAFLGFTYHGPGGLPENFFATLPNGTLVRRMVSTYISPLGVAYTALLLFPMAVAVIDRRVPQRTARWFAILMVLIILAVALSITRLAMLGLAGEAIVLWLVLRRAWIAGLIPVLVVASIGAMVPFTSIAPAVDRGLQQVHHVGVSWSTSDSSTTEHYGYLVADFKFDLQHPLGLGLGASTGRYGQLAGAGESAVLGVFGDLGLLGGGLYLAMYLLAVWHGWRALPRTRRGSLEQVLPLVALAGGIGLLPITMTSDVWGDLSVTFLFWWAAGGSATLASRAARAVPRQVWEERPASIAA